MQRTYSEIQGGGNFQHLAQTVAGYFSEETPLWWVIAEDSTEVRLTPIPALPTRRPSPIACLWLGVAIDQLQGDRHTHVFLLYVDPNHRQRGIGSALMQHAEIWARAQGDRQIGLQVFQSNQVAFKLYQSLGYQPQSLWMVKPL
jgi:ribosomal protein S18 acetylase RimI-like enzyme